MMPDMQTIDIEQQEKIYTVSRLNNEVRFLLEESFPFVWVEGEISNYAAPHSGHWYFSLKDASAQVRCAMFRGSQRKLIFSPKDGLHVLLKARVSLYENRGEFQLIAEYMEERGEGKLRRAYELLKKKLEAAGLFDPSHKKSLPLFPKKIGIITSPTGAAIRDILHVLKRRYAAAPIIIYPTLVQGTAAAPAIVAAIEAANRRQECDVLILARGGGSLEDLWPFNEEIVAQAIYKSTLPIMSGIGHEVDFTIADFVADQRAPTPSAAAELVSPDQAELLQTLNERHQQLCRQIKNKVSTTQQQLEWMQKNLAQQHPKRQLTEKMQRLDFYEVTLTQLQNRLLNQLRNKINHCDITLHQRLPLYHINTLQNKTNLDQQKLLSLITTKLNQAQTSLAQKAATLDAMSPLATLKRGFAIATTKDQEVIRDVKQVKEEEIIIVQLQKGKLECIIEKIEKL